MPHFVLKIMFPARTGKPPWDLTYWYARLREWHNLIALRMMYRQVKAKNRKFCLPAELLVWNLITKISPVFPPPALCAVLTDDIKQNGMWHHCDVSADWRVSHVFNASSIQFISHQIMARNVSPSLSPYVYDNCFPVPHHRQAHDGCC
jgi:hypothetical protein